MEHEVFVPVPVERLREALADPARVARAVPGLQQDAGTPPVAGRLKVRVGGRTITYRGALHVSARYDGSYAVEGDATEARGSGSVKVALVVRLVPVDGGGGEGDGTTVAFGGTATAGGRVADLPADAVAGAVGRLLKRFVENLAEGLGEPEVSAEPETDVKAKAGSETGAVDEPEESEEPSTSVFDAEVPPPSLDMAAEDAFAAEGEAEPPAEAAHARRTMIGRSAEEVDHAPPRGRYAPVPAPESAVPNAALRWAAPAAALAVASAVLLGRALRRRR